MERKELIDSEAVTAGAVRQVMDSANELADLDAELRRVDALERAFYTASIGSVFSGYRLTLIECKRLRRQLAQAQERRVVEQVEWAGHPDEDVCPSCGGRREFNHRDDCELAAALADAPENPFFDLIAHLRRQREFSLRTFGPGDRTHGIIDHIIKEVREILDNPSDIEEWIDVVILAFDGAWRQGWEPEQIAQTLAEKQTKNERRTWPDWRTVPEGQAIEHIDTNEVVEQERGAR